MYVTWFGRVTLSKYFDTIFVGYYSIDDVIGAVIVMKSKLLCANCWNMLILKERNKRNKLTRLNEFQVFYENNSACMPYFLMLIALEWYFASLQPQFIPKRLFALVWTGMGPLRGWNHPTVLNHWWQVRQRFLCIGMLGTFFCDPNKEK